MDLNFLKVSMIKLKKKFKASLAKVIARKSYN